MQANRVRDLVESARSHLSGLPSDSVLRRAATSAWFEGLIDAWPPERASDYLPPLLLFLHRRSAAELVAFETDVTCVRERSREPHRVGAFIARGTQVDHSNVRQWYGGVAELAIQASLVAHLPAEAIRIEPQLPNGRVSDAAVLIGDRFVWVEVTALTMSDSTYAGFDPSPGIQLGYSDPYEDARRFYRKVFDKVVGVGDRPRSQLHPTEPNLVVVCDGDIALGFSSLGIQWAATELLDPTRRELGSDASLDRWIAHDYPENPTDAEMSLRRMSGLALATYNMQSVDLLPNQAADDAYRMSAEELLALRSVIRVDRAWTLPPANI